MALSATLAEAFERFWAAYPRRQDNPKAPARLVFARRVREGADPEAIVRAAGVYARKVAEWRKDPLFIPHARTWLSQRRWEDFLEEDHPASAAPQPNPDHPLAWLRAEIGAEAWASWIAPIGVSFVPLTLTARTQLARDHVARLWGSRIASHYGEPIGWAIQRKED